MFEYMKKGREILAGPHSKRLLAEYTLERKIG
jgi:hypothetical protein